MGRRTAFAGTSGGDKLPPNELAASQRDDYSEAMPVGPHPSRFHREAIGLIAWSVAAGLMGCVSFPDEYATAPRSCPPTVQITLKDASAPFLLEYDEPANQLNGAPLQALSHTTIYLDDGHGAREFTKHSATSLRGGGHVRRQVSLPHGTSAPVTLRICVTATNTAGEGPPTP